MHCIGLGSSAIESHCRLMTEIMFISKELPTTSFIAAFPTDFDLQDQNSFMLHRAA